MNDPLFPKQSDWIQSTVDRYEGPLLRYSQHIVGGVEPARDVVQEVFLKLCTQTAEPAGRAEIEPRLAAWLFTVCRNRSFDVLRKEKRMKIASETQNATAYREAPGNEPPGSQVAEQHDENQRLQTLVAQLNDNQQEVVRLKYQAGLSYREISEITNLSVTNVGYLLHTALTTLRLQLTEAD